MSPTLPVSVVIPCFRCAETIARAVASVAAQSALPLEVILVDDGSGDDSVETLLRLRDVHPPKWISVIELSSNLGAATARNLGWEQAKGRYIAFLDADDAWHPEKLSLQYHYMCARPELLMTGHGFMRLESLATIPPMPRGDLPVQQVSSWRVTLKNPFITPSIMVSVDAPVRFSDGQRHMEDHLLLMQLALRGIRLVKIDLPLAFIFKHRYGQAGLSSDMHAMHLAELKNLQHLRRDGDISTFARGLLSLYLKLKFLRRRLIVALRTKLWGRRP